MWPLCRLVIFLGWTWAGLLISFHRGLTWISFELEYELDTDAHRWHKDMIGILRLGSKRHEVRGERPPLTSESALI